MTDDLSAARGLINGFLISFLIYGAAFWVWLWCVQ